jgi:hypothetical protein
MTDYLLLMHDDATEATQGWDDYFRRLREAGVFQGGSAIGGGMTARKEATPAPLGPLLPVQRNIRFELVPVCMEQW